MKTVNFCVLLLCWKTACCNNCELSNVTIMVEKEECGFCISVNATWCSGYCFTKDPVYKYQPMIQKVCTFKEIIYETVKIPGCSGHVESFYSYPVATGCHCETCDTDITDCTMRGLEPGYCSYSPNQLKE
ncbi:follitropin subunit beta [Hemicordylus capensis]|uniref:follitropin subunit beta n=1 Tax=Hemicordylus capensis TaxID=884348 RepID=UPI0023022EFB|nr:follitropin subunit beta [Hemicordylus capensis]